ncbi:MAG: SirB2 family protein [Rhodospirillaceae bacterium]
MDYLAIKSVHMASVAMSYGLFFVRGVWMMLDSPLLAARWVKIVPHVIDTILLASGVALAVMLRQYPLQAGWLTAKVIGLLIYIALGTIALKRGKTRRTRVTAWLAAQAVFVYIVSVAITKNPAGPL